MTGKKENNCKQWKKRKIPLTVAQIFHLFIETRQGETAASWREFPMRRVSWAAAKWNSLLHFPYSCVFFSTAFRRLNESDNSIYALPDRQTSLGHLLAPDPQKSMKTNISCCIFLFSVVFLSSAPSYERIFNKRNNRDSCDTSQGNKGINLDLVLCNIFNV